VDRHGFEGEVNYTYCTELAILRSSATNAKRQVETLRKDLHKIGDCVLVNSDDDEGLIKVHVHTDVPEEVLAMGKKYGQLDEIKIDNMRQQLMQMMIYAPLDEWAADIGVVAVANGEGIEWQLLQSGVDRVVKAGAAMNPAVEEIARAIEAVPARKVIVLPNDKNVIMTAQLAVKQVDRVAVVVPTLTVMQAFAAMVVYRVEVDLETNVRAMTKAASETRTGQVVVAAQDGEMGGEKVKKGEVLALIDGKMAFTDRSLVPVTVRLIEAMVKRHGLDMVTIFYGKKVTQAQAQRVLRKVLELYGNDAEVVMINGGQLVYNFLVWL
jgi:dihydroxyacetone kinase-like predicted kinase